MIRRTCLTVFALIIAFPLAAHGQDDLRMRVDKSTNAADPDDVPDVTVEAIAGGFQLNTGPAVVAWKDSDTASGEYTLSARFTLQEPSGHSNYYGLVYGASALSEASQNYLYFLIAQNGTYIVKHRANSETVHDIQGRTAHDAIVQPGEDGQSVNTLTVRVGTDATEFVINGTVVFTAPKSGMAARSDGIFGVRVNHTIPGVRVENLHTMN